MTAGLQPLLDDFVARGIAGAALTVRSGTATTQCVAGIANRQGGEPVTSDHLFKIGSCTKTFVAATLMSLAQDGTVALDAPVARWFPDLANGKRILVLQLIDHSAGLPEFEYDMPMEPTRVWSPAEIVALAYAVGDIDEPGRVCAYNNTGYVLAGRLIEALTGQSLAAQIRARILTPLGLRDSFATAGESFPQDRLARGYYHRPVPPDGREAATVAEGREMWRTGAVLGYSDELQDATTLFPMTGAYAAGDMVGSAADLVTFLQALVAGPLLAPTIRAEMIDRRRPMTMTTPGTRIRESGAGVLAMEYAGRQVFGHQGSMPGYVTLMVHHRASATTAALTTNTGSGDRRSFYASGLHGLMDDVLRQVI